MFKKVEKQNVVMVVCCILAILYTMYRSSQRNNYLSSDYGFTISKTIRYKFLEGFKDCIEYKYYVEGTKFIGCVTIDPKINSPLNKFYKVKYSKMKPEISEIYLSEEVTDSIKIVDAGFKYINN